MEDSSDNLKAPDDEVVKVFEDNASIINNFTANDYRPKEKTAKQIKQNKRNNENDAKRSLVNFVDKTKPNLDAWINDVPHDVMKARLDQGDASLLETALAKMYGSIFLLLNIKFSEIQIELQSERKLLLPFQYLFIKWIRRDTSQATVGRLLVNLHLVELCLPGRIDWDKIHIFLKIKNRNQRKVKSLNSGTHQKTPCEGSEEEHLGAVVDDDNIQNSFGEDDYVSQIQENESIFKDYVKNNENIMNFIKNTFISPRRSTDDITASTSFESCSPIEESDTLVIACILKDVLPKFMLILGLKLEELELVVAESSDVCSTGIPQEVCYLNKWKRMFPQDANLKTLFSTLIDYDRLNPGQIDFGIIVSYFTRTMSKNKRKKKDKCSSYIKHT